MTRLGALALGLAVLVWAPLVSSADAPGRGTPQKVSVSPSCAGQPAKVDDEGFVVIGGIEQWVTAKGDSEAGEDYSFLNFVGMHGDGMLSQVDLPKLGTDFAIPVFFIEGEHDLLAPPEMARRYDEAISAPQKGWVLLEHSGHDPNQEVVDAEYRVLREKVLPLTRSS